MVEENRSGIYIHGNSSHNVIDNCRSFRNGNEPLWTKSDRAGIAIGDHGEHRHNTIENCVIAYNGGPRSDAGLIAYKAPYTLFQNNHVHDNYGSGIFVTINSHNSTIINNVIENNGQLAVLSGQKGIVGLTIRHGSQGTIVKDNIIHNNFVSPDSPWKGKDLGQKGGLDIRGIRGRDDMTGITIKNNVVTGTKGGPDIYIDSKIDLTGIIIEPESQAPWWYKEPLINK
jgi:parallel beta-helix repeat protein